MKGIKRRIGKINSMCRSFSAAVIIMLLLLLMSSCGQAEQEAQDASVDKVGVDAETYYEELENCVKQIRDVTDFKPKLVLVLGTGLNSYADKLDIVEKIPYSEIDGWPNSTAPDHEGNLIFAKYRGLDIAVMQGRVHYYEGYPMHEVVKPVRVLHLLGADTLILTNAVGAINTDYNVGDFVCVRDHISSFVPSPLVGENIEELGERFTPMDNIYDKSMQQTVLQTGKEKNIPVHSGIYLQTTGPQYETPAEIRMYRELGADTVGMSSAVEAIAAVHMGMKVCDINCVTNMAAGIEDIENENITKAAKESSKNFEELVDGLLDSLATS